MRMPACQHKKKTSIRVQTAATFRLVSMYSAHLAGVVTGALAM